MNKISPQKQCSRAPLLLSTGCPQKNIPIDPPKLQFLTYTFEISVVGRHFHSGFSAFYGFEKF